MISTRPARLRPILGLFVILSTLILASCGGGVTTAGVGGSGIGGTGVTRVSGNVVQVVSNAREFSDPSTARIMLASLVDLISPPATAQSGMLSGIPVSGGGVSTVTDGSGKFNLENVKPSSSFVLTFMPQSGQAITLQVGAVPDGARVQVINVVLNTSQGSAKADDIEVEEDDSGDDNSNDPGGDDGDDDEDDDSTDDDDSVDDGDEEDDNSTDD